MKLKDAYDIVSVSAKETEAIKRYLNFEYNRINILSNLTSEAYEYFTQSGGTLLQTEEELKQTIEDFVAVYSAMYKESCGKALEQNIVTGTSSKQAKFLVSFTSQFLSGSTDTAIAQATCPSENPSLVSIKANAGVPFLNTKNYEDQNGSNKNVFLISPFCEVLHNEASGNSNGYDHFQVTLGKPCLEEKTETELNKLWKQVLSGFSQNIENMNEHLNLIKKEEELGHKYSVARNKSDRDALAKDKDILYQKLITYASKTNHFKLTLQNLLKGLCKQKELEIDAAREIIYQNQGQEKLELQNEATPLPALDNVSATLKENLPEIVPITPEVAPENFNLPTTLENNVVSAYHELVATESRYKRIARRLGVEFDTSISTTNIRQNVTTLQENMKQIQSQIDNLANSANTASSPLSDEVAYGLALSKELPNITQTYASQLEHNLKRNLYYKVQSTLQDARVQNYVQQREEISKEPVGFLGILTGKATLKDEKLKNINLKMKLAQSLPIQEPDKFSARDMLASIYACTTTELDGTSTPDMYKLYVAIKETFQDTKTGTFSDEYISQLANKKTGNGVLEQATQTLTPINLPVVSTRKFHLFGNIKSQIHLLKLQNGQLLDKVVASAQNKNTVETVEPDKKPDALVLFEHKLRSIVSSTKDVK